MNLLHHQIDSHSVNDSLFDKLNVIYQREEINTISYVNLVNLLLLRPWEKTNLSMTFLFYIPYGGKKKKKLVGKEIATDFVITVWKWKVKEKVTRLCPILCNPMNYYSPWNSPGQNARVGSLSFLQRIFPIQGLNPGLPHYRKICYQVSHRGSHNNSWKFTKCHYYYF